MNWKWQFNIVLNSLEDFLASLIAALSQKVRKVEKIMWYRKIIWNKKRFTNSGMQLVEYFDEKLSMLSAKVPYSKYVVLDCKAHSG